ncbi:hypothetical protein GQ457_08G023700 [Hibiscus cannabinus]
MEVGKGVNLPTPYEVSDVYLGSSYEQVREWLTAWIYALKTLEKKSNVAKLLKEAKKVICFIYNHIWTVDLMKKHTNGKQILLLVLTRFSTHFIQLEEITRQKQGLRDMLNSKDNKSQSLIMKRKKLFYEKIFWKKATNIVKVYESLVKVMRLVDSDEKPTMGIIYEDIDRTKRAINENCRYSTEYKKDYRQ